MKKYPFFLSTLFCFSMILLTPGVAVRAATLAEEGEPRAVMVLEAGAPEATREAVLRRRPANLLVNGDFGDGLTAWRLRDLAENTPIGTAEFPPGASVGEPALGVRVAPGEQAYLCQVAGAPLVAGARYQLTVRYRQQPDASTVDPAEMPLRVRLIAYPADGENHQRQDRMWLSTPSGDVEDWSVLTGVFAADRDYRSFRVTLFMNQPGEYVIDEVSLEPLSESVLQ